MDHYKALGIGAGASRAEVAAAYADKVREMNAANLPPDAQERRVVEVAFNVLTDDERRLIYDSQVLVEEGDDGRPAPPPPPAPSAPEPVGTEPVHVPGPNELHPDTFDMSSFGKEPDNLADALARCEELLDRQEPMRAVSVLLGAVETYQEVEPDWVPRCLLKAGIVLERDVQDQDRAAGVYRRLMALAPDSKEARRAASGLERLGASSEPLEGLEAHTAGDQEDLGDGTVRVACPSCEASFVTRPAGWALCPECGEKVALAPLS